jgi:hypothetical protein
MKVQQQIQAYLQSQPEPKQIDMVALHNIICEMMPKAQLWFLDGKDESGKVVSNPNIGYGVQELKYADGSIKSFYKVGISANTTGISIYIMGLSDKNILKEKFGNKLGKVSVTGYCIKFKKLADIDLPVLLEVLRFGFEQSRH